MYEPKPSVSVLFAAIEKAELLSAATDNTFNSPEPILEISKVNVLTLLSSEIFFGPIVA